MPYFSIIIPLFNKQSEIKNTLNSVLNQNISDFEIIIVNDGSTDNSLEIVNSIIDPRIQVINIKNGGVSNARNTGILAARGLYIALLDGDDIWLPNYLNEIEHLIKEFHFCNIFCTDYSISSINENESQNRTHHHVLVSDYYERAMNIPFITSSSVVIKRDCFNSIMKFDVRYTHGEDLDMWAKLFNKYGFIGYSDKKLVYYNHSATNRACSNVAPFPEKHFAYYLDLNNAKSNIEKKYYLNQISLIAWLYIRSFRIFFLFSILKQHKKHVLKILMIAVINIFINKYKVASKNK